MRALPRRLRSGRNTRAVPTRGVDDVLESGQPVGTRSLAANINLGAQADHYLSLEFLVAASGAITSTDVINVTLTYSDATTAVVAIKQGSTAYLFDFKQATGSQPDTTLFVTLLGTVIVSG